MSLGDWMSTVMREDTTTISLGILVQTAWLLERCSAAKMCYMQEVFVQHARSDDGTCYYYRIAPQQDNKRHGGTNKVS